MKEEKTAGRNSGRGQRERMGGGGRVQLRCTVGGFTSREARVTSHPCSFWAPNLRYLLMSVPDRVRAIGRVCSIKVTWLLP